MKLFGEGAPGHHFTILKPSVVVSYIGWTERTWRYSQDASAAIVRMSTERPSPGAADISPDSSNSPPSTSRTWAKGNFLTAKCCRNCCFTKSMLLRLCCCYKKRLAFYHFALKNTCTLYTRKFPWSQDDMVFLKKKKESIEFEWLLMVARFTHMSHLANGPWKKSLNFIFPTKYGIPKSLKG